MPSQRPRRSKPSKSVKSLQAKSQPRTQTPTRSSSRLRNASWTGVTPDESIPFVYANAMSLPTSSATTSNTPVQNIIGSLTALPVSNTAQNGSNQQAPGPFLYATEATDAPFLLEAEAAHAPFLPAPEAATILSLPEPDAAHLLPVSGHPNNATNYSSNSGRRDKGKKRARDSSEDSSSSSSSESDRPNKREKLSPKKHVRFGPLPPSHTLSLKRLFVDVNPDGQDDPDDTNDEPMRKRIRVGEIPENQRYCVEHKPWVTKIHLGCDTPRPSTSEAETNVGDGEFLRSLPWKMIISRMAYLPMRRPHEHKYLKKLNEGSTSGIPTTYLKWLHSMIRAKQDVYGMPISGTPTPAYQSATKSKPGSGELPAVVPASTSSNSSNRHASTPRRTHASTSANRSSPSFRPVSPRTQPHASTSNTGPQRLTRQRVLQGFDDFWRTGAPPCLHQRYPRPPETQPGPVAEPEVASEQATLNSPIYISSSSGEDSGMSDSDTSESQLKLISKSGHSSAKSSVGGSSSYSWCVIC